MHLMGLEDNGVRIIIQESIKSFIVIHGVVGPGGQ